MLKKYAFIFALLTTMWVMPSAAQGETALVRTEQGLRFEIPAGWEWTKFDGHSTQLQHLATKTGEKGKESSPAQFVVSEGKLYKDDFDQWTEDRLDYSGKRSFPNGATARWKAGARPGWGHYQFWGEATIGAKALNVTLLTSIPPSFDMGLIESAFLSVVESLQNVPESAVLYHPGLRIATDARISKSWGSYCGRDDITFTHYVNGVGKNSHAHIYAYPAFVEFPDIGKALADITIAFEKNSRLKIGEVRSAEFTGGQVLWTEQPGTRVPFLAAVLRDGRYFFVQMDGGTSVTSASDAAAVREDFLAVAKSVRAWDGN